MEVKDVLENYTNLEKECESAKQSVSVELQVSIFYFYFYKLISDLISKNENIIQLIAILT